MGTAKRVIGQVYLWGIVALFPWTFVRLLDGKITSWADILREFNEIAFWLPPIALLMVVSAQVDLLSSLQEGGEVNIKARVYDFFHWLLLIAMNVGAWMIGSVTIGWFIIKLLLLAMIGWQIGVGTQRANPFTFSPNEKTIGAVCALLAVILGVATGIARYADAEPFGIGWLFESATAIIATVIVVKWILTDLSTICHNASGYPRSFF